MPGGEDPIGGGGFDVDIHPLQEEDKDHSFREERNKRPRRRKEKGNVRHRPFLKIGKSWISKNWGGFLLFKKFWKLGFSSDPRKLPALKGIHSTEEFSRILRRERERADRNGHQFSLLFFEINHKDRTSRGLIDLAEALSKRIRLTDEVGWLDGHLGVFLPETPPEGACKVADDICAIVQSPSPDIQRPQPRYHLYCYPLDKNERGKNSNAEGDQTRGQGRASGEKQIHGEKSDEKSRDGHRVEHGAENRTEKSSGGKNAGGVNSENQSPAEKSNFFKNRLAGLHL